MRPNFYTYAYGRTHLPHFSHIDVALNNNHLCYYIPYKFPHYITAPLLLEDSVPLLAPQPAKIKACDFCTHGPTLETAWNWRNHAYLIQQYPVLPRNFQVSNVPSHVSLGVELEVG